MKLHSFYEKLLNTIEDTLEDGTTIDKLAGALFVSPVHLQRLFKAAFEVPLASYIRSRKLAASLDMLLNSNMAIIDIANSYGFDHAQSYIRAFKSEFGLTPGELRKTGQIIKVKPPIQILPGSKLSEGMLFGPEIVFVPGFNCVGRKYIIPYFSEAEIVAKAGRDFWLQDSHTIPNVVNPNVYIGLTKLQQNVRYSIYTPSVCVTDFSNIPAGFEVNVIPSCYCARFRYIGEHHYLDINNEIARGMYEVIDSFEEDTGYAMYDYGIYFERIDTTDYDGTFCKMEWFSPVRKK